MSEVATANIYQIKNYLMWYDFLTLVKFQLLGDDVLFQTYDIQDLTKYSIFISFYDPYFESVYCVSNVGYDEYDNIVPTHIYLPSAVNMSLDKKISTVIYEMFKGRENKNNLKNFFLSLSREEKVIILRNIDECLSSIPFHELWSCYEQKSKEERDKVILVKKKIKEREYSISLLSQLIDVGAIYQSVSDVTGISEYQDLKEVLRRALLEYDGDLFNRHLKIYKK